MEFDTNCVKCAVYNTRSEIRNSLGIQFIQMQMEVQMRLIIALGDAIMKGSNKSWDGRGAISTGGKCDTTRIVTELFFLRKTQVPDVSDNIPIKDLSGSCDFLSTRSR